MQSRYTLNVRKFPVAHTAAVIYSAAAGQSVGGLYYAFFISTPADITETLNHLTTDSVTATLENPAAAQPEQVGPDVNPLTGLPEADPNTLNRRPIVVKISNAPPLVHPGLGSARLIWYSSIMSKVD